MILNNYQIDKLIKISDIRKIFNILQQWHITDNKTSEKLDLLISDNPIHKEYNIVEKISLIFDKNTDLSIDELALITSNEPSLITKYIYQNYPLLNIDLDNTCDILDTLVFSNTLQNKMNDIVLFKEPKLYNKYERDYDIIYKDIIPFKLKDIYDYIKFYNITIEQVKHNIFKYSHKKIKIPKIIKKEKKSLDVNDRIISLDTIWKQFKK